MRIASGLALKQNLFDGVLDIDKEIDTVDFTEEGRAQFMEELKTYVDEEEIMDPMAASTSPFEDLFTEDDIESEVEGEAVFDFENIEFDTDELEEELDWGHYLSDVLDGESEEAVLEPTLSNVEEKPSNSSDQYQSNGIENEPQPKSNNAVSEVNSNSIAGKTKSGTITVDEQEQMEDVLNKGLDFLAGLYQMSTGKKMMDDSDGDGKNISIDKETGEVVLRFKLK